MICTFFSYILYLMARVHQDWKPIQIGMNHLSPLQHNITQTNQVLIEYSYSQRFNKVLDSMQNGETFGKKFLKKITTKTLKEMTKPLQHPQYQGFFTQQMTVNDSSASEDLPEVGLQ